MKHNKHNKKRKKVGFTIIEVMIVLAIAGLIMMIVFIAIPSLQAERRDIQRKSYAQQVFSAMEEYAKNNNGHFLDPNNGSDWARFLVVYMPDSTDPSTGESYKMANVDDVEWVSHGQTNPAHSVVIYDGGVPHNDAQPEFGQVVIATGHICQSAHPDSSGNVLSDVAFFRNHIRDVFSIVIYQERGEYYCIDNYQDTTP
jgi:prepilin-type N-terminal cleavage/methylation domain-containing protein